MREFLLLTFGGGAADIVDVDVDVLAAAFVVGLFVCM